MGFNPFSPNKILDLSKLNEAADDNFKVTLLLIYLAVLFLLARLLEVVSLYEHGQISRRLLDPMALSVLKLKALLEQRGVSYEAVVEKTELKELVEATGSVSEEEVESTTAIASEQVTPITNFTGHLNFYEQVEDAKDSMWLVEVTTDTGGVLSDTSWNIIQKKVSKFGVRFGRFDCHLNVRMCARRQWYTPQLVLALPDTYKTKANVALYSFSGSIRISSLFDWIKVKVNTQIEKISSVKNLQSQWLDYDSALDPEVRVIFISTLSSVPLFLSALSVKFPGRVKIGHIDTKTDKGKSMSKKLNLTSTQGYLIVTKDKKFFYGHGPGKTLTFRAFEIFLKSIYPNMNDLFICSMILTNIACCFEIILISGDTLRRVVRYLLCMFKFNLVLMLFWILVLGIVQTGIIRSLCLIGLKGLRLVTTSTAFSYILKDFQFYAKHLWIPIVALGCLMSLIYKIKSKYFHDDEDSDEEFDWWNFSNLQTLDYSNWWETTRLRPFDQIFNPTAGIMGLQADTIFDFHEPVISKEYIKYLPTWRYHSRTKKYTKTKAASSDSQPPDITKVDSMKPQTPCDLNHQSQSICSTGSVADSLLDSNYSCECSHLCQCTQRNSTCSHHTSTCTQGPANVHTDTPLVDPEEAHFDELHGNAFTDFAKSYETENLNMHSCMPAGYKDTQQCVICLDSFTDNVLLRGLPCYHVFHSACILSWLMRENHFCPICRAPANGNKGHLYFEDLHDE